MRTPVRALMFTFRKTAQPTGSIHPFRRFDPPLPPENRPPGSIHSLRRFDPLLTSRKRRNDFESVPSQQFSGRVQPAYSSKLLDPADSVRAVRIKITPSSPPPKIAGMTLRAFHHSNSQAEFSLRIPQNCSIQRTAS
ncbi:hypothetical protein, partial [Bellilinea sp.]